MTEDGKQILTKWGTGLEEKNRKDKKGETTKINGKRQRREGVERKNDTFRQTERLRQGKNETICENDGDKTNEPKAISKKMETMTTKRKQ